MKQSKVLGVGLFIFLSALAGTSAFAQVTADAGPETTDDSKSTMKMEEVDESSNKVKNGEDADLILTNNKLRAESGSKSRWSIASTLTYNGGTLAHPFGDERPDITQGNGISNVSDIEGGISVKYNITTRDSLIVGETIRYVTPLSGSATPTGYNGQKFDNFNPGITYQRIYKVGGWQSYFQVGPTLVTQTDLTAIGYLGNFGIYNASVYDIGHSRFSVGVESGATYAWFRDPQAYPDQHLPTEQATRENSSNYDVFLYPYLEYKISDSLNIRTVCMWFQAEHTLAADNNTWKKDVAQQSIGLGFSVTRDIFLYPNVQFIPDQLRPNQTNVALATNINIF